MAGKKARPLLQAVRHLVPSRRDRHPLGKRGGDLAAEMIDVRAQLDLAE